MNGMNGMILHGYHGSFPHSLAPLWKSPMGSNWPSPDGFPRHFQVETRRSATARTDGGAEPLHLAATKGALGQSWVWMVFSHTFRRFFPHIYGFLWVILPQNPANHDIPRRYSYWIPYGGLGKPSRNGGCLPAMFWSVPDGFVWA